ncbi:hypothetical protein ACA910_015627 [Epithemia clementina (nom. ined.)]
MFALTSVTTSRRIVSSMPFVVSKAVGPAAATTTATITRLDSNSINMHSGSRCWYSQAERGFDAAASRLHNALEEYRRVHYTQELPMRFKKEIVAAACQCTAKKYVTGGVAERAVHLDGLHQVLCNIGMMQDRLTFQDLQLIFEKEGKEGGAIPVERLYQIL